MQLNAFKLALLLPLPYHFQSNVRKRKVLQFRKKNTTILFQTTFLIVFFSHPSIEYGTYKDILVWPLPFYHIFGISSIFCYTLNIGGTTVVLPKFQLEEYLRAVQKYKVCVLPLSLSSKQTISKIKRTGVSKLHQHTDSKQIFSAC